MLIVKEVGPSRIAKHVLFTLWQVVFDLLPFSPLRILWLRFGRATIGKNCVVDKIDFINLDRTGLTGLKIGNFCFLGRGVLLDLAGPITLEDWVIVSPRASLLTHMSVGLKAHPLFKKYPPRIAAVRVKRGAFIGSNSTILHGVTIGEQSLIGAGAVVTKNILAHKVAVGVPARG